jgi:hypothetical protein
MNHFPLEEEPWSTLQRTHSAHPRTIMSKKSKYVVGPTMTKELDTKSNDGVA